MKCGQWRLRIRFECYESQEDTSCGMVLDVINAEV